MKIAHLDIFQDRYVHQFPMINVFIMHLKHKLIKMEEKLHIFMHRYAGNEEEAVELKLKMA